MKRKLLVIGIGTGNPEHVTVEAIKALNRADALFIPDKGEEKSELAALRREICDRYIEGEQPRLVSFSVPMRKTRGSYEAGVGEWHARIEAVYARLLAEELDETQTGALLIWGDPGLYDSALRILEKIHAKGEIALEIEVVPGIGAVQALAAAHKIPLNRIGQSVLITTGRRLADGFPEGADSVIVMLDGQMAFGTLDDAIEIYWGAYLGSADQILISGRLGEVRAEIERVRAEARARKGWIMDSYLLRKPTDH